MEEKHVPLGFPRGRAGGAEPSMRLESVASFASHDLPPHLSPGRGGSALPASHRPREAPVITFTLPSHGNESARSEASAEDSDGQGREVNRRQKKRRRPNGQNKVTPARNSIVFTDDVEKAVLRGRRLSSAHYTLPIHQMTRLTMSERREYYFRHPTARIFVAVSIIFLNFIMVAEDPQAHSKAPAEIPVVGGAFSLLARQWPSHGGYATLKFLFAAVSLVGGAMFMLHVVHHRCLRRRLEMFSGDKGSWWIMFVGTIAACFIGSLGYNACLAMFLGQTEADDRGYWLTSQLGATNSGFMKVAGVGTWIGDSVTAFMVIDMVLQTDRMYPDWLPGARRVWNTALGGNLRIILFWLGVGTLTVLVATAFGNSWIDWDNVNKGFVASDEFTRALLASMITVCDILILAQDFDFPEFNSTQSLKLPGLGITQIKWDPFGCINRKWLAFEITGKWFNYGIILIVMILDFNMLKNQVLYSPEINGQYVGPDDRVYTVVNQTQLPALLLNTSLLSWDVRMGEASGDVQMNAKYKGYSMLLTSLAAVPAVAALFALFYLIRRHRMLVRRMANPEDATLRQAKLRRIMTASWRWKRVGPTDGEGNNSSHDDGAIGTDGQEAESASGPRVSPTDGASSMGVGDAGADTDAGVHTPRDDSIPTARRHRSASPTLPGAMQPVQAADNKHVVVVRGRRR